MLTKIIELISLDFYSYIIKFYVVILTLGYQQLLKKIIIQKNYLIHNIIVVFLSSK